MSKTHYQTQDENENGNFYYIQGPNGDIRTVPCKDPGDTDLMAKSDNVTCRAIKAGAGGYIANQALKADAGKPRVDLVPLQILYDIAAIREYGNRKYPDGGPDNWKRVEPERYRAAMMRHMIEYIRDPKSVDAESGLPHLWHLATNCAFLCELEVMNEHIN